MKNITYKLSVILLFILTTFKLNAQVCSSGTLPLILDEAVTVNGVSVTTIRTGGDASIYNRSTSSCSYTVDSGSVRVGTNTGWSLSLTFDKPVNNLIFVIVGTGPFQDEDFIFNANTGTVSITDMGSCYTSAIIGNTIYSGAAGPAVGQGGGGYFKISTTTPFTKLDINGHGGGAGSVIGVCSASVVPACNAGTKAPVLKIGQACAPVNLNNYIDTTAQPTPPNTIVSWFTNNTHTGSPYANPTNAAAGTYYAFYYDSKNNCYSPASVARVVNSKPTVSGVNNVCIGSTLQLTGTGGTVWTSSTPAVAIVNSSGLVTPVSPGSTYITYTNTLTGCASAILITVNALPSVSGSSSVFVGESIKLTTGSAIPDTLTPWTSSNPSIAYIDNLGNVNGLAQGVVNITYKTNTGCMTSVPITVFERPIISGDKSLCRGNNIQLLGSGIPATINPWVSGNTAIAVINNQGRLTGIAPGFVTITYKDANGNTATINVEVRNCGYCFLDPITNGTVLETTHGITALGRAGSEDNDNWPMIRKGAWTVLEAKTKGFVINRLTSDEIANIPIANCVEGMMVYDTTNNCLKIYTTKDNGLSYAWECFNEKACPN